MCDNLIFTNIPEIDEYESPEETENFVKIFVSDILQIVENFELHVAHRLRPRPVKHQGVLSQSLKNIKTVTKYWKQPRAPQSWKGLDSVFMSSSLKKLVTEGRNYGPSSRGNNDWDEKSNLQQTNSLLMDGEFILPRCQGNFISKPRTNPTITTLFLTM